jgi:hypothetical protein
LGTSKAWRTRSRVEAIITEQLVDSTGEISAELRKMACARRLDRESIFDFGTEFDV